MRIRLITIKQSDQFDAGDIAEILNRAGITTFVDSGPGKLNDRIRTAILLQLEDWYICIGQEEIKTGLVNIRNIKNPKEDIRSITIQDFIDINNFHESIEQE